MKWKEYQGFCVLFVIGTLVLASIYAFAQSWPKYEENFFALGILGRNLKLEEYYPGNDTSIEVGDQVLWHIYIYNHWNKTQRISIAVKVLNSTMPPPDDFKDEPSPVPPIMETTFQLDENETRLVPFLWHIEDVEFGKNIVTINKIVINDETIPMRVQGKPDSLFRIVFELWMFNEETGTFEYGWHSEGIHYCVWNGIWFSVTPSTQKA